jgi:acyl-CoA synthetase (AMP-forming)/AMP-acid ligase II
LPRRIHDLVERHAAAAPDALALIDHDGRCRTWHGFRARWTSWMQHLRATGVRGGDRVLVVLENSVTAVAALMAASRLEAWAALVNARLAAPELARIRAHCEPRAIVFTTGASGEAARHAADAGAPSIDDDRVGAFAIAGHLPAKPAPVDESNAAQVAAMIYTSGTTGDPKGVMLTHRNVLFIAVVSWRRAGALGADDLVYAVLPVSHVFGLASTCLGTINPGGALRLVNRFDPAHLAEALRGGVTVFQACRRCTRACSSTSTTAAKRSSRRACATCRPAARRSISAGNGASRRASGARSTNG